MSTGHIIITRLNVTIARHYQACLSIDMNLGTSLHLLEVELFPACIERIMVPQLSVKKWTWDIKKYH
jgi:hypothetical protein